MFKPAHRKAQLFTMDLLLALVPLTIALGMSGSAVAGVTSQIQEYAHSYSMQRQMNNAMDTLIKSAGVPPNWNSTYPADKSSGFVPGLAAYDTYAGVYPEYVDETKFTAFSSIHSTAMPLLLSGVSYYNLTLQGLWGNASGVSTSLTSGSKSSCLNVYVTQRLGLYKFAALVTSSEALSRISSNSCSNDNQNKPIFEINFTVTSSNLNDYDYWLVATAEEQNPNVDAVIRNQSYVTWKGGINPCNWVRNEDEDFGIFPIEGNLPACSCTSPSRQCQEGGKTVKTNITSYLTAGQLNYVFLRMQGKPNVLSTYYVVRMIKGTCSVAASSEVAEYAPARFTLEVGR